jgi:hypothetical protein
MELCPSLSWTTLGCVPEANSKLAWVWRNPCRVSPQGLRKALHDVGQAPGLQWLAIRSGDDMLGNDAKSQELFGLLGFPALQLFDRHRRERDGSRPARLRVLLPDRTIIALFGGRDDGKLSAIEVYCGPAQSSDHPSPQGQRTRWQPGTAVRDCAGARGDSQGSFRA